MDDDLESLARTAKAFRRAEAKLEEQRRTLHEQIVATVKRGQTKSEVARRTGYTREYVARICDR